ncbi:alpha-ketoacid dehydrogenase subunit beta [bacterium]|nr:alpha-ketoacid dehydrogenase subunit beta [bacterium]
MTRTLSFRDALNEAIVQEMDRDPNVFVFGLDVPDHKRIFGSTKGLVERFGKERCFGTPLSEEAMTGMALGAAISGLRPIHVHIRVDFLLLAMNQLLNMVSNFRYLSGGTLEVPLVIRAIIGRGWGQGAQHSKSLQSVFAHVPGLKVVMPTTPNDAKGLLISAIRDDNPVVFLEHRWLYDVSGEVTCGEDGIPLSKTNVLRRGKDATVVATSWMNVEALKAAEILSREGVEVEVVDPRTIAPLDDGPIIESCARTGHCVVADYDWSFCGFGAELAARIMEKCWGKLRSPVSRVGFAHVPCPTTRCLESEFYPNAVTIIRVIEKKLGLKEMDLSGESFYTWESRFRGPF